MKAILHIFAFMGALGFGWVAFADEGKKPASEESIQVVCPVNTEENCENCDTAKAQPVAENPENK